MSAEHEHDDELSELLAEDSSKFLILHSTIPRPIYPGEESPELPDGPHTLFIPIVKPE
jgi:hypothetical protein